MAWESGLVTVENIKDGIVSHFQEARPVSGSTLRALRKGAS